MPEFLSQVDFSKIPTKNLAVENINPTSYTNPVIGSTVYYLNKLHVYDGSNWQPQGTGDSVIWTPFDLGSTLSGTVTIDFNVANMFYGGFVSNITLSFSNQATNSGKPLRLALKNYDSVNVRSIVTPSVDVVAPATLINVPPLYYIWVELIYINGKVWINFSDILQGF